MRKPHIRLKGGIWRVMGPQGTAYQEREAKSFVRALNRLLASRRTINKGNAAWQELGR